MDGSERPSKQKAFLALLNEGWVSLHIDARRPGVVVPASFASQAHLVLQYGRSMPVPIHDLEVTDAGVSATLSFSRVSHRTYVPWSAVYVIACTNGCGVPYSEDVPHELRLSVQGDDACLPVPARLAPDESAAPPVDEPWLRSIPPSDEATEIESEGMILQAPERPKCRPQLRVVK
jgi:stringent starvation protein B